LEAIGHGWPDQYRRRHLTKPANAVAAARGATGVWRRKLKLKPKLESNPS
jgi:hypothetical protein